MTRRRLASWRVGAALAAGSALVAVFGACADNPPTVAEVLTDACLQARDDIAAAPAPVDAGAEAEFVEISGQAADAVGNVAQEVADRGDDTTIADMAWQLHRFPSTRDSDRSLAMAQEANAAIVRLDRFADRLQISECGAATWRPADWRALADRHGDRLRPGAFLRRMNRLCADTFPRPSLLADGTPLLQALAADANARAAPQGATEDTSDQLISRFSTSSGRQSDTALFFRHFALALPQIRPPEELEGEYLGLLAAFMTVESTIPRTMSRDPPPAVRERVAAALDELQRAWDPLDITCRREGSSA